jgi:hypothetical protein
MFGILAISVIVVMSGALTTRIDSPAQARKPTKPVQAAQVRPESPRLPWKYSVVQRLSETARKVAFAQIATCRAGVARKAEDLYPEMKLQSRNYSVKEDVKRFRERAKFEDAGVEACAREALEKHAIDRAELQSIISEGACRQWPPLRGKPACE